MLIFSLIFFLAPMAQPMCPHCGFPSPRSAAYQTYFMLSCDRCGYLETTRPAKEEEEPPLRRVEAPLGRLVLRLKSGSTLTERIHDHDALLWFVALIRDRPDAVEFAFYTFWDPGSGRWRKHVLRPGSDGPVHLSPLREERLCAFAPPR